MNIGKMRYRCQILDKEKAKDNEGNVPGDWPSIGTIWAGVSSRTGTLTQQEYGLELSMTKEIMTRPTALLLEGRRVVLDSKTYQIMHIDKLPGMYVSVISLVGDST